MTEGLKTLAAGEYLFLQGQAGHELYFLKSGALEVVLSPAKPDLTVEEIGKRGQVIETFDQPGQLVGEISPILDCPRTASIRAVRDSTLQAADMRPGVFENAMRVKPMLGIKIAEELARRINKTNERLKKVDIRLLRFLEELRVALAGFGESHATAIDTTTPELSGNLFLSLSQLAGTSSSLPPDLLVSLAMSYDDAGAFFSFFGGLAFQSGTPQSHTAGAATALAKIQGKKYSAGEVLCTSGEEAKELFILLQGRLNVVIGRRTIQTIAGRGNLIGEMAFLLKTRRTASVIAVDPSMVLAVPFEKMEALFQKVPQLLLLMLKQLASRLLQIDTLLQKSIWRNLFFGEILPTFVQTVRSSAESLPASLAEPVRDAAHKTVAMIEESVSSMTKSVAADSPGVSFTLAELVKSASDAVAPEVKSEDLTETLPVPDTHHDHVDFVLSMADNRRVFGPPMTAKSRFAHYLNVDESHLVLGRIVGKIDQTDTYVEVLLADAGTNETRRKLTEQIAMAFGVSNFLLTKTLTRPASGTPALGASETLTRPASAGVGDAGTSGRGAADPGTPAPGASETLTRPAPGASETPLATGASETPLAPGASETPPAPGASETPTRWFYKVQAGGGGGAVSADAIPHAEHLLESLVKMERASMTPLDKSKSRRLYLEAVTSILESHWSSPGKFTDLSAPETALIQFGAVGEASSDHSKLDVPPGRTQITVLDFAKRVVVELAGGESAVMGSSAASKSKLPEVEKQIADLIEARKKAYGELQIKYEDAREGPLLQQIEKMTRLSMQKEKGATPAAALRDFAATEKDTEKMFDERNAFVTQALKGDAGRKALGQLKGLEDQIRAAMRQKMDLVEIIQRPAAEAEAEKEKSASALLPITLLNGFRDLVTDLHARIRQTLQPDNLDVIPILSDGVRMYAGRDVGIALQKICEKDKTLPSGPDFPAILRLPGGGYSIYAEEWKTLVVPLYLIVDSFQMMAHGIGEWRWSRLPESDRKKYQKAVKGGSSIKLDQLGLFFAREYRLLLDDKEVDEGSTKFIQGVLSTPLVAPPAAAPAAKSK